MRTNIIKFLILKFWRKKRVKKVPHHAAWIKDNSKVSDYLRTSPNHRSSGLILTIHFILQGQMLFTYWHLFTRPSQSIFSIITVLNYSRNAFILLTTPLFTEAFPIILRNDCQPICLEPTWEGEEQENQLLYRYWLKAESCFLTNILNRRKNKPN